MFFSGSSRRRETRKISRPREGERDLSLFEELLSSEKCGEIFSNLRWKDDVHCPRCNSKEVVKRGTYDDIFNQYYCNNCGRWFNPKTDTLFHNSKLSLKKWFFSILLTSFGCSMNKMARLLDISYKTAMRVQNKLQKDEYQEESSLIYRIREVLLRELPLREKKVEKLLDKSLS